MLDVVNHPMALFFGIYFCSISLSLTWYNVPFVFLYYTMFTNRLQVGILKNKYQSPLTNILQYAIPILGIISVPFIAVCNIFRELKSTQRRTEHTRFIAAVFSIYYQQPFFTYFFYVILSERESSMK